MVALPNRRTSQHEDHAQPGTAATEPDWRALYEIENPVEVDAFVGQHAGFIPVLEQAATQLFARFGQDTRLLLQHRLDYEDEPPSAYLSVGILTDLDDDDAYARLDRFDAEWWLDAMRSVAGDLTIDVTHR